MGSLKKKAAPIKGGDSYQYVTLGRTDNIDTSTPVMLSKVQLSTIHKEISETAYQERDFVEQLAFNPLSDTKACCYGMSCVNISDLRQRTAKLLSKFGLEARCVTPPKPILNRKDRPTNQKLWSLYLIGGES